MTLDVAPTMKHADVPYGRLANAELASEFSRTQTRCADETNVIRRELRRSGASNVLCGCGKPQMGGIDAIPLIAEMVDLLPRLKRADLLFVDQPVSEHMLVIDHQPCVAVDEVSLPDPAPCAIAAILSLPEIAPQSKWAVVLAKIADVAEDESHRLSANMPEPAIGELRNRRWVSAAAFAQSTAPVHTEGV